jgi:hypothetical protein
VPELVFEDETSNDDKKDDEEESSSEKETETGFIPIFICIRVAPF